MLNEIKLISIVIILIISINSILCSIGDRLPVYRNCFNNCFETNCSNSNAIQLFERRQPFHLLLIGWNCPEECKHECQWITINQLIDSGLKPNQLPQFYGKVFLL